MAESRRFSKRKKKKRMGKMGKVTKGKTWPGMMAMCLPTNRVTSVGFGNPGISGKAHHDP
jgi:hypothetical protein